MIVAVAIVVQADLQWAYDVSSNFVSADFRKMRTDSFQKSRIIPTIPQSDTDCDEVGHQQGHGPSLPANEREGV